MTWPSMIAAISRLCLGADVLLTPCCLPSLETNASNAQATICAYGHYFVSREAATTWPGLHPEAVLLSVEDAARLAEALASAARRYAEKAEF
jgi:hypothetical protein